MMISKLIFHLDNESFKGGAIALFTSSINMESVDFRNNAADLAGHIFLSTCNGTISYTNFIRGTATTSGGCIVIHGTSSTEFDNCNISNCIADSNGSGILLQVDSSPIFNNCTIS